MKALALAASSAVHVRVFIKHNMQSDLPYGALAGWQICTAQNEIICKCNCQCSSTFLLHNLRSIKGAFKDCEAIQESKCDVQPCCR